MKSLKNMLCVMLSALMIVSLFSALSFNAFAAKTATAANADEFNLSIDKIEVEDVSVYENINSVFDDFGKVKFVYSPKYKVYLKDGTIVRSDRDGEVAVHNRVDAMTFTDDQDESPWGVGEHHAIGEVFGVKTDVKVTVKESPVEKVDIKDITLYQDADSVLTYYYGDDATRLWAKYAYTPEYTVTFKDGTVLESDDGKVLYDNVNYKLDVNDGQEFDNQWDIGEHKINGAIFGITDEFTVTIERNPVESFAVKAMELVENSCGYIDEDDDEPFYKYQYKVTDFELKLNDGTVIESDGKNDFVTVNGRKYKITAKDTQADEHWTKGGTYQVVAEVMGVKADFEVKIVESPAEKLEVEPISLVENWDSYDDNELGLKYYTYSPEMFNYKVILKNGEVLESKDGVVKYNGVNYTLSLIDDQSYKNNWIKGNTYDINASIFGVTAKAKAAIVDTIAESVFAEDISLKENVDGYVTTGHSKDGLLESYFKYDVAVPKYTVTLKDGTKLKSNSGGDIVYKGVTYSPRYITDQSYDSKWASGLHKAEIEILGVKSEYTVNIESDEPEPVTEPAATESEITEPTSTEPISTEPATESIATEPESTAPDASEPAEVKTAKITLAKSKTSLYIKGTYKIKSKVENGKGATTYTSSNPKIAKVDKNGKVTALKKGTAKITVANNGAEKKFTVKVKNPKLKRSKKTIKIGKTYKIKIIGQKGKAKFKSDNKKIAAVTKTGKIKAKKKGKATITVTTNGKIKLKFRVKVK